MDIVDNGGLLSDKNSFPSLSTMDTTSEEDRVGTVGPETAHPPLSPATAAESFFLSTLQTNDRISAFALAAEIQKNRRSSSSQKSLNAVSVATDDFASACDNSLDIEYDDDDDVLRNNNSNTNMFGKDVLIISRTPIPEDDLLDFEDPIMTTEPKTETGPGPSDVAANVYEGVKDVWAWGKGTPFSPLLGLAEGVVSKVIGVAGTNLEEIDGSIRPQISQLDQNFLNPAIHAVVGLILEGVGKGEHFVRPIVMTILGPVGLAQIDEEKPEEKKPVGSANPEITTPVAVDVN